jgi:hypothetical protein
MSTTKKHTLLSLQPFKSLEQLPIHRLRKLHRYFSLTEPAGFAENSIRQDFTIAQENIWRVNGDENKLAYFHRPLLSKDALMFIHQVTRFAGFLSDFTSTSFSLRSLRAP